MQVSIIINNFNYGSYLKEAIDNVGIGIVYG